jgi:hypothetical protein
VIDIEIVGKRGFFRPVAEVSFEQGVELIMRAMKQARELGLAELVVNILGLTGFRSPGVFARYELATRWVESAGASLRVVWVSNPGMIDFQKIAVLIAQNRGTAGDVFATELEALHWLDAHRAPRDRLPDPEGGQRSRN